MKLGDIYSAMIYGEMQNLFHRKEDTKPGQIDENELPRFTNAVQRGLTAIHSRFDLRRQKIKVKLVPNQLIYPLSSSAIIAPGPTVEGKYIDDTDFPFDERSYLKAVEVLDSKGVRLPLNDMNCVEPFREIQPGVIMVPESYDQEYFTLWFRADHPTLNVYVANKAPSIVDVDIRPIYLEALINFVASKLNAPAGFGIEGTNQSNNYEARYERECIKLENKGNQITEMPEDNRFRNDGWA